MNCVSCAGRLRQFLDLGFHPPPLAFLKTLNQPETFYPLTALRCVQCGLVQQGYSVDPKVMWGGSYFYNSGATPSFAKHLDELAETCVKRFNPKRVVDIGSSDGTLLQSFQKRGCEVIGVEPSDVAKMSKVPVVKDFFGLETADRIVAKMGKADLITATNVFAHFSDIEGFMAPLGFLLSDDGIFVSESQYLFDIIKQNAYDCVYHEHQRVYSLKTISSFLKEWDFHIFDADRVEGIGGSMRVFATKKEVGMSERGEKILEAERNAGLDDFRTYERFAENVKFQKRNLMALLWRLKRQGNRIVAIGAAGRSTTLANYCAIGPDLVDYATEVSPLKIGYYTPGMHIPVVSEERLFKDNPHYALIFSWHLADKIMPKLREHGYSGKFILPLPQVKVIDS